MRQVAERAGVALTTVSRAFSDPDKLSPATLKRIETATADLNYTLNLNARSLRRRSRGVVLVLLPDIGNPFFSQLLKGMEEAAREHGRVILIGDTGSDAGLRESYAMQLQARTADALILLDGQLPFAPETAARAHLLRSPVVAVSERVPEASIPYVGIDNEAAARDVAALLAGAGHRRVAHIRGTRGNMLTEERARGFAAGAKTQGLTLLGSVEGHFSIEGGREAALAILGWPDRPTAVFASSDEIAMGAIHAFKSAGLRVPDDLSVIGFDDIDFAAIHEPGLTTVRQPRRAMGRAAVDLIANWTPGSSLVGHDVALDYRIVRRASLGPPPGR